MLMLMVLIVFRKCCVDANGFVCLCLGSVVLMLTVVFVFRKCCVDANSSVCV